MGSEGNTTAAKEASYTAKTDGGGSAAHTRSRTSYALIYDICMRAQCRSMETSPKHLKHHRIESEDGAVAHKSPVAGH